MNADKVVKFGRFVVVVLLACSETGLTPDPTPRPPPAPADAGGVVPDAQFDEGRVPGLDIDRDADDWLPPSTCSQRMIARERIEAMSCPFDDGTRPSTFEVREVWRAPLNEPSSHMLRLFIAPPSDAAKVWGPEVAYRTFSQLYSLVDGSPSLDAGEVNLRTIPDVHRAVYLSDGRLAFVGGWGRLIDRQGNVVASPEFALEEIDRLAIATSLTHYGDTRVIDLDGDGSAEVIFGRHIFSLDGTRLAEAPFEHPVLRELAFIDADGDGQLDIATGAGIFDRQGRVLCEVDPSSIAGRAGGSASPVVFHDGGDVELFIQPWYYSSRSVFPGPSRVQDLSCRVRRESKLSWDGYDSSTFHVQPLALLSTASSVEPAIVAVASDGHPTKAMINIYDRNFKYLRTIYRTERGYPLYGFGVFFDIDGDGLVEWIVLRHDEVDRTSSVILAIDLRDGTEHVIAGPANRPRDCYVSDAEGDGHSELYCFEDVDDQRYLVRYEGVDRPWASSFPYYWPGFEPHQHDHTGTVVSGPVDIAELGGFHWMPSTDTWTGRNADLIVQITDVCDEECERGWMTAWVQIGNQGRVGLSRPVVARLYGVRDGEEHLVGETRVQTAPKGWWNAAPPLRFPAGGYERLRAEVAGDGWEPEECDLTNNEDVWELSCG